MQWFGRPKKRARQWISLPAKTTHIEAVDDREDRAYATGTESGPIMTPTHDEVVAMIKKITSGPVHPADRRPSLESAIESCDRFRPTDPLSWLNSEITLSPSGVEFAYCGLDGNGAKGSDDDRINMSLPMGI